jgi:hypothetical protein
LKSKPIIVILLLLTVGASFYGCASNNTPAAGELEVELAEKEAMISQLTAERKDWNQRWLSCRAKLMLPPALDQALC